MTMKYRKGNHVKMTSEALDNYGEQWNEVELIVTSAANKYMPANEFFRNGKPEGYHPGYDEGVSPQGLYDLARADNGKSLGMSLYDWELRSA
jgi:hypothetical protein